MKNLSKRVATKAPAAPAPEDAEPRPLANMRQDILDATSDIIVARGYEACTMRAIAKEVRIKAGSLYHHFTSKDQIIEEIMNVGLMTLMQEVVQALDKLPSRATFFDRWSVAVSVHVDCLSRPSSTYMRVYEYVPPVLKRRSREMRKKYATIWYDMLKVGQENESVRPEIDAKVFIPFFLGGLNRVPEWIKNSGHDGKSVSAHIVDIMVKGILTPKKGVKVRRVAA